MKQGGTGGPKHGGERGDRTGYGYLENILRSPEKVTSRKAFLAAGHADFKFIRF